MAYRVFTAGLAAAIGLTLAGLLYNFSVAPMPAPPSFDTAALEFDGTRALELTTTFVTTYPDRSARSLGRSEAAQWLVDEFISLGYDPQVQTFGAWVGEALQPNLCNVWAVKEGQSGDAVVVHAHYDTPFFVTQGAADDGSGVISVLELARIFASTPVKKTIVFACLDDSEYGNMGARTFLSGGVLEDPIVAAVGLDFLNTGPMAGVSVECMGTGKGYSPPWLRHLAVQAARQFTTAYSVSTLEEWAERSVAVAPTDTGIFLQRGVPSVNLAGVPTDVSTERAVYHTSNDLASNLDASAFANWGRTAELIIRTVDGMETIPGGSAASSVYLGLPGGQYAGGWAIRMVQFLVFSPLWVLVGLGWYRRRKALAAALVILRDEARRVSSAVACLFAGYAVLKVAPVAGLLHRYPVNPATPRDPYLLQPVAVPLILALAAVAAAVYLVARRTAWFRPPLGADWQERYHAMMTILAVVVFLVWLEGAGYAAVSFLALPVYLWVFLAEPAGSDRARLGRAIAGGLVVAAGTVPFWIASAILRDVMMTGPVFWYFALGAAYGLFGLKSVVVFLTMAALHGEAFVLGTGVGSSGTIPTRLPSDTLPAQPTGGGLRA